MFDHHKETNREGPPKGEGGGSFSVVHDEEKTMGDREARKRTSPPTPCHKKTHQKGEGASQSMILTCFHQFLSLIFLEDPFSMQ